MSEPYPKWAPQSLIDRTVKMTGRERDLAERLLRDPRMQEVWQWWEFAGRKTRYPSAYMFHYSINQATRMPGKPGNMSPKRRAEYMAKVSKHAQALLALLEDTRYDCRYEQWSEVDIDRWQKYVEIDLGGAIEFCASEGGELFVGYRVTEHGVDRCPWDYPYGEVAMLLEDVIRWTEEDDYFGRGGMISSKAIRASDELAEVNFFNCTLYGSYLGDGLKIPFPILATLANVVFELPPDEQITEDTARKQVSRYMEKVRAHEKVEADKKEEDLAF